MTAASPAPYRPVRLSREFLAGKIPDAFSKNHRKLWDTLSPAQRAEARDQFVNALAALEESLATGSPAFLESQAAWAASRFAALHFPPGFARAFFAGFSAVLADGLPPDYRKDGIAFARKAAPATGRAAGKAHAGERKRILAPAPRAFLAAALAGDTARCRAVIDRALAAGQGAEEIYTGIFVPVLRETGMRWQEGKITIAGEHHVSALIRREMERLHARAAGAGKGRRHGRKVIAACAGEELHDTGLRMAADLLEADGWDVYYLGANTPAKSILAAVEAQEPDLLLLSATMPERLGDVEYLVRSLRAGRKTAGVKVLAGGPPFALVPGLGKQVGADAVAASVEDTVPAARKLFGIRGEKKNSRK